MAKPAVWFVSIASVLLVGLLGTSYIVKQPETFNSSDKQISQENDDNSIGTYEKWIERMTKKYKRVKEDISRELKVSVEELNTFHIFKMQIPCWHSIRVTTVR